MMAGAGCPTSGRQLVGLPKTVVAKDSHALLIRAGFIRQSHSGLFQFLPLGLRVQSKLERLLDHHMTRLGASKVSLSTLSSEDLWKRSGRLNGDKSELFRIKDRRKASFLLAPTHEEEITSLVANAVYSYKDLPLRLYQITRKYRDELRPRQGLLRAREFLMKDLYTFDATKEDALRTYKTVQKAYSAFFNEFRIPYLTAEADSGSIGGDLSHEYHVLSTKGEDNVISCSHCQYVANEEVANRGVAKGASGEQLGQPNLSYNTKSFKPNAPVLPNSATETHRGLSMWSGISRDRQMIYQAFFPSEVERKDDGATRPAEVNLDVLGSVFDDIDRGVQSPLLTAAQGAKAKWVFDYRLSEDVLANFKKLLTVPKEPDPCDAGAFPCPIVDLVKIETGDQCHHCESGTLRVQTAIELGHTFYLGTKYSKPLGARIAREGKLVLSPEPSEVGASDSTHLMRESSGVQSTAIEMGCHGIGVSRMIAAVADALADDKGLNWPRVMAPFEIVIIPAKGFDSNAEEVMDLLARGDRSQGTSSDLPSRDLDAILDDREKEMAWKLNDADLIGYPVIVVLGKAWKKQRKCEVQCRRLSLKEDVPVDELWKFVTALLARL